MNNGHERQSAVGRKAAAPAGFSLLRMSMSDGSESLELWLPTELTSDLIEEQRATWLKRAEEQRLKLERVRAAHLSASSNAQQQSTAKVDDDAAFAKAFDRGVSRRNRARRHPVVTSKELVRVAGKV